MHSFTKPLLGAAKHCAIWATSSTRGYFYANPNFNNATDPANRVSIYCIHGTADRSKSFASIAASLQPELADNMDGIYLLTFEKRFQGSPIEEFALQLCKAIKANPSRQVVLFGHSRGGIVASYFAEVIAASEEITVRMIKCYDSPFQGSVLARWPVTKLSDSVAQMAVGSTFLTNLCELVQKSTIPYYYVGSGRDQIVRGDAWRPPFVEADAPNCLFLTDHGHLSVMNSERVKEATKEELRGLGFMPVGNNNHNNI